MEWSASRTGLINPVAVFEPVELEGTTVSRASVHNVSIVEQLALGVGDHIPVSYTHLDVYKRQVSTYHETAKNNRFDSENLTLEALSLIHILHQDIEDFATAEKLTAHENSIAVRFEQ